MESLVVLCIIQKLVQGDLGEYFKICGPGDAIAANIPIKLKTYPYVDSELVWCDLGKLYI